MAPHVHLYKNKSLRTRGSLPVLWGETATTGYLDHQFPIPYDWEDLTLPWTTTFLLYHSGALHSCTKHATALPSVQHQIWFMILLRNKSISLLRVVVTLLPQTSNAQLYMTFTRTFTSEMDNRANKKVFHETFETKKKNQQSRKKACMFQRCSGNLLWQYGLSLGKRGGDFFASNWQAIKIRLALHTSYRETISYISECSIPSSVLKCA